jgi:hypothetical protein
MWPYAIPFYVVRIAEMRPVLIAVAVAAAITIAILIWRKPERYVLWIAAIIVGAILLVFLSWRHMFDAYDEVEVVARTISVGK